MEDNKEFVASTAKNFAVNICYYNMLSLKQDGFVSQHLLSDFNEFKTQYVNI